MVITTTSPLILASQSPVRADMLREAGLEFTILPSPYDEEAQKAQIASLSPAEQGAFLADGKAKAVSEMHPEAYVIGADQVCALQGQIFGKPHTKDQAIKHLQALQGSVHHQHSAACIYHQGRQVFATVETVTLEMKPLNHEEIIRYIETDQPLNACGAYCYEKTGHTLFQRVDGSADAIKGLPLAALLEYLRRVS